jgi:GAF domain-containing protein
MCVLLSITALEFQCNDDICASRRLFPVTLPDSRHKNFEFHSFHHPWNFLCVFGKHPSHRDTTLLVLHRPYSASSRIPTTRPASALSGSTTLVRSRPASSLASLPSRPASSTAFLSHNNAKSPTLETNHQAGGAFSLPQAGDITQASNQWLEQLVTLMQSVNNWPISLDPHSVQESACRKACDLVQCERSSLFLLDDPNQQLVLLTKSDSDNQLKVPYGSGITGTVGVHGGTLNVPRADLDSRYVSESDHYPSNAPKPYSMLCVELKDTSGVPIAVIQAVNKKSRIGSRDPGCFTRQDETMLQLFGMQVAAVMRCCDLHARSSQSLGQRNASSSSSSNEQNNSTVDRVEVDQRVRAAVDELMHMHIICQEHAVQSIANKVKGFTRAEHCTVFWKSENEPDVLWTAVQNNSSNNHTNKTHDQWERVSLEVSDQTTAGWCATRSQVLQVKNLALDPRFNRSLVSEQDMRAASGCSILCVPVFSGTSNQSLQGVIEVIKRAEISESDKETLVGFSQCVPAVFERARQEHLRSAVKQGTADLLRQATQEKAIHKFKQVVSRCMGVDVHVRYFAVDAEAKQLVCTLAAKSDKNTTQAKAEPVVLRKAADSCGIEGHVAREGKVVRLNDAWIVTLGDGSHMSQTLDEETGLAGRRKETPLPLMCMPVRKYVYDPTGNNDSVENRGSKSANKNKEAAVASPEADKHNVHIVVGVVQILGAHAVAFTDAQEEMVQEFIDTLQVVLGICASSAHARDKERDVVTLLRSLPEMYSEFDMQRLLKIVAAEVCQLLGAQHCTTYMIDSASGDMWTRIDGYQREIRLPQGTGMVGAVASTAKTMYVPDCFASPQYGSILAEAGPSTGVRTVLMVPVMSHAGAVMAVLQAFHPGQDAFDQHKHRLLEEYARLVAVAMENQQLASKRVRDIQRGIPVEWDASKVHATMRESMLRLLGCEAAAVFQSAADNKSMFMYVRVPATARSELSHTSSKKNTLSDVLSKRDLNPENVLSRHDVHVDTVRRDVSVEEGIVGQVFTCGDSVLTEAAHLLTDFDYSIDSAGAKEARTLLCVPMYDSTGKKIGVLLAVNKRRGKFTRDDEAMLKLLASQWAECIVNNGKYAAAAATIDSHGHLFKAARACEGVSAPRDLTDCLCEKIKAMVPCDKSVVFLVDADSSELVTYAPAGSEVRVPISKHTVAGMVAQTCDVVHVHDIYTDERFAGSMSKTQSEAGGVLTKTSVLSVPVRAVRGGTCVAVLQLMRFGAEADMFTDQHEKLLRSLCEHVAANAVKTLQANKMTQRLVDLVDVTVNMAKALDMHGGTLQCAIKSTVRRALACEKVNVYLVDVMRRVGVCASCVGLCMYLHIQLCMYMHPCVCVCMCMCICMHAKKKTSNDSYYVCIYMHTRIYMHI